MVSAIGATSAVTSTFGGSASAALQAQLALFQHQLADCVNCASSKTPEGKAAIEAISGKISAVKARLQDIGDVRARPQGSAPAPADPASAINGSGSVVAAASASGPLGNLLDVLA